MRGTGCSGTLSISCIFNTTAFHLSTRLDAVVCEMAGAFTVSTDNFAVGTVLCCKGSGWHLEALFLMGANEVFLMLDGTDNSVGRKGWAVRVCLNERLQVWIVLAKSVQEEDSAKVVTI